MLMSRGRFPVLSLSHFQFGLTSAPTDFRGRAACVDATGIDLKGLPELVVIISTPCLLLEPADLAIDAYRSLGRAVTRMQKPITIGFSIAGRLASMHRRRGENRSRALPEGIGPGPQRAAPLGPGATLSATE
jgi:hypothetical protein